MPSKKDTTNDGAVTNENEEVRTVESDDAMSPEDLEAEIAATAAALGEAKTVNGKPVLKNSKANAATTTSAKSKAPTKSKPTNSKVDTEQTDDAKPVAEATEESASSATVEVSKENSDVASEASKPKETKTKDNVPAAKDSSTDDSGEQIVVTRKMAEPPKPVETGPFAASVNGDGTDIKPKDDRFISRSGKKIQPISEMVPAKKAAPVAMAATSLSEDESTDVDAAKTEIADSETEGDLSLEEAAMEVSNEATAANAESTTPGNSVDGIKGSSKSSSESNKATTESEPKAKVPEKLQSDSKEKTTKNSESGASGDTARKLKAISSELDNKEKENKEKPVGGKDVENELYDTKKYHVPIKANRHHRKSALPMWAQILILIIAILGALAYGVYSGLIDVDIPYLSESSEEDKADTTTAPEETSSEATQEQTDVALAKESLLSSLVDTSKFNTGDVTYTFSKDGNEYSFSGKFYVLEDGQVYGDFVGESGIAQAKELLGDEMKAYKVGVISPLNSQTTASASANTALVANLNIANMAGYNEELGGNVDDVDLIFSEISGFFASEGCEEAATNFAGQYMNIIQTDKAISEDSRSAISKQYNLLESACSDRARDFAKVNASVLDNVSFEVDQTTEAVTVTVKNSTTNTSETLVLGNLKQVDSSELIDEDSALSAISSDRYIDLVLMGRCEADSFNEYKEDLSVVDLALASECKLIKSSE